MSDILLSETVLGIMIFSYILMLILLIVLSILLYRYKRRVYRTLRNEEESLTNLQTTEESNERVFNFTTKIEHFHQTQDIESENVTNNRKSNMVVNTKNRNLVTENGNSSLKHPHPIPTSIIQRDQMKQLVDEVLVSRVQLKSLKECLKKSSSTPELDIYDVVRSNPIPAGKETSSPFNVVLKKTPNVLQIPNSLNRKSVSTSNLSEYDTVPNVTDQRRNRTSSHHIVMTQNLRVNGNRVVKDDASDYLILLSELQLYQNS